MGRGGGEGKGRGGGGQRGGEGKWKKAEYRSLLGLKVWCCMAVAIFQ